MGRRDFTLSELARRLTESDGTLAWSIGEILSAAIQEIIEAELVARIGAEPGERSSARTVQRNGRRPKELSTPATHQGRDPQATQWKQLLGSIELCRTIQSEL